MMKQPTKPMMPKKEADKMHNQMHPAKKGTRKGK